MAQSGAISAKFDFELFDYGLDLYDGAESLLGLSRVIKICGHYYMTDKVIFFAPTAKGVRVFMRPSKEGSLDQLIQVAFNFSDPTVIAIWAGAAGGVATKASELAFEQFSKLFRFILQFTIGQTRRAGSELVSLLGEQFAHDYGVLAEALLPAIVRMHRPIATLNCSSIDISESGTKVATLDSGTLSLLTQEVVDDQPSKFHVNVSVINVPQRTGRVFLFDEGRSIPFKVDKAVFDSRDLPTLTWSANQLAEKQRGEITVTGICTRRTDDLIKSIKLVAADRLS